MNQKMLLLFLLLLLMVFSGCAEETVQPQLVTETTAVATVQTEPEAERFVLTFAGDCTLGSNPNNYYAQQGFVKTVGEDYGYPFRNVLPWLEEDTLTLVNLEGPLTDESYPVQNKKHTFRGPTAYTRILTGSSVEFVSLSNNHTLDYGKKGYAATLAALEEAGVGYVEQDSTAIVTTDKGLKVGIYGAMYYRMDTETIVAGIAGLKAQGCDVVIFAPHWGAEGSYKPTAQQKELAHAVIDAGADVVWGSHPHVLQPIERYGDGIIFYSLGNFSFGGNACPTDYDTALMQLEIIRDPEGTVSLGELTVIPASVSSIEGRNNFQPTPYQAGTEEYERVLSKLEGTFSGSYVFCY